MATYRATSSFAGENEGRVGGKNMSVADPQAVNRQVAQALMDEARWNPQSPYAGKFVGIAGGQVVAVADDWDELARRLRQAVPDPTQTFSVEVGRDYSQIEQIWGLC